MLTLELSRALILAINNRIAETLLADVGDLLGVAEAEQPEKN